MRLVIKIGTSVITSKEGDVDKARLDLLCRQIAEFHKGGHEIVVITSGAIGSGRSILKVCIEKQDVPARQMLASVGQVRLMGWYYSFFGSFNINVAQLLLTRDDLSQRLRYLNIRNTLLSLLKMDILPVINENDVVAFKGIEELRFGDNDNLAAMVSLLVDADLLLILTDVAGLYDKDPRVAGKAQLIREVKKIDKRIEAVACGSTSGVGTGGMHSKVEAAKKATVGGVKVVIANGRGEAVIKKIISGSQVPCTVFLASETRLKGKKRWLFSGASSQGEIVVDNQALGALKKDRSLLPVGVVDILGDFDCGSAIDVLDKDGNKVCLGLTNYSSKDLKKIRGEHSANIIKILGYSLGDEVIHRDNLVLAS